ncbi:MAG: hypothetical protein AB7P40_24940 [Chloroflexota bacterium]
MSELSTADLAGGTTARPNDAEMTTRDSAYDLDREDRELRDNRVEDGTMPPPAQQPSRLANPAATDGAAMHSNEPLFPSGESEGFRTRWTDVQTGFVDEPRMAVEQADSLVAEMMKRLAQVFADERAHLEEQWSRGDDISTEDLRQALRRYRSFFDRLLQV